MTFSITDGGELIRSFPTLSAMIASAEALPSDMVSQHDFCLGTEDKAGELLIGTVGVSGTKTVIHWNTMLALECTDRMKRTGDKILQAESEMLNKFLREQEIRNMHL